ncbi:MAG: glycosyltransferase family 39 protein [Paracoccaceae bacterium]
MTRRDHLDVAWEMWQSGDAFHLSRNYELYTHKPPLLFWLINLVWLATGVSEWAARLVGPAFGVASVFAAAALARRIWPGDRETAARAALMLASFSVFLLYGGATMFDTMLTLATGLGIALLWAIGSGEGGRRHWVGFGVVLAFGVYAKGPVIFVHLLPALLTMRVWAPEPPGWRVLGRGLLLSIGVGLAVVALWLVPALLAGSDAYRHELLWTQSAARVAGGLAHDRPVWFLAALLPVLLFPWGWSLRLWRAAGRAMRADHGLRLAAIWSVSGLVLFSLISGKQAHYLMPEFPAVALLLARAYGSVKRQRRHLALAALVPAVLGLGVLCLAAGLVPVSGDLALLAPTLPVVVCGLLLLAVAVAGWRLGTLAGPALMGAGVVLVLHAIVATTGLYGAYDARAIAARLHAAEPGGLAETAKPYHAEFNFAGRLSAPVATPSGAAELRDWAAANPGGLLFGPVGQVPVAAAPETAIRYNQTVYGFWPASQVALSVRE